MTDPLTYRTDRFDPILVEQEELEFTFVEAIVEYKGKMYFGGPGGGSQVMTVNGVNAGTSNGLLIWDGGTITQPDTPWPSVGTGGVMSLEKATVGNDEVLIIGVKRTSTGPWSRVYLFDGQTYTQLSGNVYDFAGEITALYNPGNETFYAVHQTTGLSGDSVKRHTGSGWEAVGTDTGPMESAGIYNGELIVGRRSNNGIFAVDADNNVVEWSDDFTAFDIQADGNNLFIRFSTNRTADILGQEITTTINDLWLYDGEAFSRLIDIQGLVPALSPRTHMVHSGDYLLVNTSDTVVGDQVLMMVLVKLDTLNVIEVFSPETFGSQPANLSPPFMWDDKIWRSYGANTGGTRYVELPTHFELDLAGLRFLPFSYTPIEEQLRVFWDGAEVFNWSYDDGVLTFFDEIGFGSKLVAFRETRSNQSWVEFTGASMIRRSADMMTYFNQRLFILQELCEMQEVAEEIGHPITDYMFPEEDDSAYSVQAEGQDVDINALPFPIINDPIVRPEVQLTVVGVVGDLEIPFEFNPDHEEVGSLEWGIDGDGLIVVDDGWNVEGWPIKVKRNTRIDRYWHTVRDASSFPSTPLIQMSQQLKFLIEESCGMPDLPDDHPLNNTIFPRGLNWLNYVGPGPSFFFGHMPWAGVFDIFVYVNNILLEDHEWSFDWEGWNIVIPGLSENDVVTFGPGGFGSTDPGGLMFPNSDADDTETAIPSPISAGKSAFGDCCSPESGVVSVADDGTITITGVVCPCPEDAEELEPPAIFSGVSFNFQDSQPGWAGEGGFGPGGSVVGRASGYRWKRPNGDEWIELYRVQDCGSQPSGVGRRFRNWTYTRTEGGPWVPAHSLTPCVQAGSEPAWVSAAKGWYEANVSSTHPIAKHGVGSIFGSLDTQEVDNSTYQSWNDALDSIDPNGAEMTLNEWLIWYYTGTPILLQEPSE